MPNGSNVAVTRENRLPYIHLVSHYRLTKQIKLQSEAFFEGLSEMIQPNWLRYVIHLKIIVSLIYGSYRMFNQQEVQIVIGGVNSPIDLDDLQRNTNYGGAFDEKHETIVTFWKVYPALVLKLLIRFDCPFPFIRLSALSTRNKKEPCCDLSRVVADLLFCLLSFSLSQGLLIALLYCYYSGFKELAPNFCIRDSGYDQYRLPTSSTCVNLLKASCVTNELRMHSH